MTRLVFRATDLQSNSRTQLEKLWNSSFSSLTLFP